MSLEDKFKEHGNHIYRNEKDAETCLNNYYPVGLGITKMHGFDWDLEPVMIAKMAEKLLKSFQVGKEYCFFDELEFSSTELEQELQELTTNREDLEAWIRDLEEAHRKVNRLYCFNEIVAPDLKPGDKGENR